MGRRRGTRTARGRRGGLHHRFSMGLQDWEGERLLAAWLLFWAEFGRCGGRKLSRSWRCVKEWRRVTAGKSRKPHHLTTWQEMVADLGLRRFPQIAIYQNDLRVAVSAPRQRACASRVSTCWRPLRASANSGASCYTHRRDCRCQKQELTTIRSCWTVFT